MWNERTGWWGHRCFSDGETQSPVAAWLRKMVLKVDGRLSAQAMDKLQGLSRLGSANLVRPRRCLNGPSNSASRHCQGDRRDKTLHPSQIAGGGPFTFLKEEKQRAWKDHLSWEKKELATYRTQSQSRDVARRPSRTAVPRGDTPRPRCRRCPSPGEAPCPMASTDSCA